MKKIILFISVLTFAVSSEIKNKSIEKSAYESYVTMDGDDTVYNVSGFDPNLLLPDEDVYKPKKKTVSKSKGLDGFMEGEDWR